MNELRTNQNGAKYICRDEYPTIRVEKNTKFKKSCEVCGHKFIASLQNKNIIPLNLQLHEGEEDSHYTGPLFGKDSLTFRYNPITLFTTVCPNCHYQDELGVTKIEGVETYETIYF
jgi:hypothetical protein